MADSLTSPGLIKACNDALVACSPDINIPRLFAYDMSDEFADWGTVCKVPICNGGSISAFNMDSNDYEHQDGTVTYATVTLSSQPKCTFEFKGLDKLEAPNAPYWRRVADAGADVIKSSFSKDFGALFTADSCTGGSVTLSGDITKTKIAQLRKSCKGRVADTVLALDSDLYADVLGLCDAGIYGNASTVQNGKFAYSLFGFKAVVELRDADASIRGALIPTDAVAFASRAVPVGDEGAYTEYGVVTDPETGLAITAMRHGSCAKGKAFVNLTELHGMALVQPTKVVAIVDGE